MDCLECSIQSLDAARYEVCEQCSHYNDKEHAHGRWPPCTPFTGPILKAHHLPRDPRLAALSPEELQAFDVITRKLALLARDARIIK
jgi:hypothetical protein